MILEGLVTTCDAEGRCNLAPMGPVVAPDMATFRLRPYQTSTTYQNLRATRCGVLHVTDDVELIAHAALDTSLTVPPLRPAAVVNGQVLVDCCRWYEFEVTELDHSEPRTRIECLVRHQGQGRDFFGFNRAKHAVLEATILATRLHLLPADEVRTAMQLWAPLIEKTAGPGEVRAWEFVTSYIDRHLPPSALQ